MNWNQEIYLKAWNFATLAHQGQTYGGIEPGTKVDYINHISSVAMETIWAVSQETDINADLAVQCALLHDTVEDTKITYEDIVSQFSQEVADGVQALSKNENLPSKREQTLDSLERIQQQPKEIWMVKMADRISNLYHPPHYWNAEKILAYRDNALLIYEALHPANENLAGRLQRKIEDYPKFLQ